MRIKSVGGSRLIPEPKMPPGLVELMEDLTRSVLRDNATDVYEYCANHMAKLLEIRDGRAPIPRLTLEQKITRAQNKMRKKAEIRRRKYDMEMELLRNSKDVDEERISNEQEAEIVSVTESKHKTPIRPEDEIAQSSELEISHQDNDDSITKTNENVNKIAVISIENPFKDDSVTSKPENLNPDAPLGKEDVEMVISKVDVKSDNSEVPHNSYDTTNNTIIPKNVEETEFISNTAVNISSADHQENMDRSIVEITNQVKTENVTGLTEVLTESMTKTKVDNKDTEIKKILPVSDNENNQELDSIVEVLKTEADEDKKQNQIIDKDNENKNNKFVNEIKNLNKKSENISEDKYEMKENRVTDSKSDSVNASNAMAKCILSNIIEQSELSVNKTIESKELGQNFAPDMHDKVEENHIEEIKKNAHDAAMHNAETETDAFNSIIFETEIMKQGDDTCESKKDNKDNFVVLMVAEKENNISVDTAPADEVRLKESNAGNNTKSLSIAEDIDTKNMIPYNEECQTKEISANYDQVHIHEGQNQKTVDTVSIQDSSEQNNKNEIRFKVKTAYVCGEEQNLMVDEETCIKEKMVDANMKIQEQAKRTPVDIQINSNIVNTIKSNSTYDLQSNDETPTLEESCEKNKSNEPKTTINATESTDKLEITDQGTESSKITTNHAKNSKQLNSAESNEAANQNVTKDVKPIDEIIMIEEDIEKKEINQPDSSNLDDNNVSKIVDNVKTVEPVEEASEVTNYSHTEHSDLINVTKPQLENIIVTSNPQHIHEMTSIKKSCEKNETRDNPFTQDDNDTNNAVKSQINAGQILNYPIGEIKVTDLILLNDIHVHNSDSDENKANSGDEKENEQKIHGFDPVMECEVIEITVVENGHKDNDASIELPQDDTPTIGDISEYERNKRTEDEISDIQEISGISDLPQLNKSSSTGDSTTDDNSDSNVESDNMKESNDSTQSPRIMDLEIAAVTIQKVFRSFMFKSRCSTFDDTGNDENNSVDEDNEDVDYEITSSKERRPLGISRMDTVTVLQTVNEEKSLSLSTDDSSLSSAATIIQAHVRGFLVRNRLNSSKASSSSLVNSDGQSSKSFETDGEQQKNKTILNIQLVPEGGHYLSRDESVLTSVDLSLDGSPPSSINLHPLGYDKNEPRKQLKREDAVQSISPPSNNSGKLSEDIESVKEVLPGDPTETQNIECAVNEELHDASCETSPSKSTTVETVVEVERIGKEYVESSQENIVNVDKNRPIEVSSDEGDVVSPFITNGKYSRSDSDNTSGLIHSGEFHDIVLPTKVARKTSVVREFKNVLVYFIIWNANT